MALQMYKIYVNDTPVFLIRTKDLDALGLTPGRNVYVARYLGKKKQFMQYLDLLEKNGQVEAVCLYADDLEALWADFRSCFKLLEAAGGLVRNAEDRLLVFFRRGFWDMPKGKIDPGETPEQAALREVREETGLVNVEQGAFAGHTWHTYREKKERVLKKTWWYHMHTRDTQLTPQTEEDIETILWVEPRAWLESQPKVYRSIAEIIRAGEN